ncbi:hypothetical protein [Sporosarcina sp. E16_8]|uniref:hypothetical protein n=1 Tax=Sporosarcina sp. E16_8 TaxID=2789295 RepID=UPI001A90F851|nr:hypothetical protein [Sporosarcina sp. E16_8]MBO0586087.1 hypothetical protein [Sporosarcina sp. E16_8]
MPNNDNRNPNREQKQNQDRNKNQNPNDMREEFGTTFDIDKLNEQKNDTQKQKEQRTNRFEKR